MVSEPPTTSPAPTALLANPLSDAMLIERIRAVAVLHGAFTLRSGRTSRYYVDKYLFETQPDILASLGHRFAARIARLCASGGTDRGQVSGQVPGVDRVAGAELGGIPLVSAAAMASGLPMVLVRNQKKGYGTAKQLEGVIEPGDRVVVVEDIVTSGGQSVEAAKALTDAGAEVVAILAVIDRQEGAREAIEAAGFAMQALFTKADLGIAED